MSCAQSLSVVIATLGGKSLISTIERLNQGSIKPAEILVCVPELEASAMTPINHDNVRILPTPCRGQVAQRAFGFRQTQQVLVMQLDDDMSVDLHCLESLVEALGTLGSNVAVAPALIDERTGRSVYARPGWPKGLQAVYFWLMNGVNGYQPGKIDRSGSAIGLDPATSKSRFVAVEWLAGGCVLHHRENLVLDNFWPRSGKAYCEDIVHSHLLSQRGIQLIVDTSARCELEVRQSTLTFGAFMCDLYRDFCARKYYMKRVSKTSVRVYFYYLIRALSYAWKRLRWHQQKL